MTSEWPIFTGVPREHVDRVLTSARRRTFARGEVVFHEGDPADTLHLVRAGRFAVRVTSQYADSAVLAVVGPGRIFGELALLSPGAPRSATVAALEPAETLALHQHDFARLRREHPATNELLIAVLAEQVRRLSRQLLEALHLPAETRVRLRVLELTDAYDGIIPLTQEELAELAGTSRATVNRVLRDDARSGFVRLSRGETELLDHDAVRRLAGV